MDEHLKKARNVLEQQGRFGSGHGPKPEEILEAIREMLAYLEELDKSK